MNQFIKVGMWHPEAMIGQPALAGAPASWSAAAKRSEAAALVGGRCSGKGQRPSHITPLRKRWHATALQDASAHFCAFIVLILGVLLLPFSAAACRYSIRDTGFVDLGTDAYVLDLAFPAGFTAGQRYSQAATGLFLEANVGFNAKESASPALRLADAGGRSLDLLAGQSLPTDPAAIARLLESVVASPRREDIHREALRAYAVVVLVEGTDATDNERVRAAIQNASAGIAKLMPSMPKPVDVPPQMVTIPVTEQGAESVLIWGLGFEPRLSPEARVALVYGRGRRLGSPLEGALITRTALQERLAMIGQDCECDLDRAWLKGPVLPGRWDRELQQLAAKTLGFDPENPMVRTEVSRIVLRGEGDKAKSKKPSTALALGYTEESVDAASTDSSAAGDEAAETTSPASTPSTNTPPSTPKPPPLATPSARPVWFALFGFLAAAVAAGLIVLRRSLRN
jgi:hypothetical protein